MSCRPKLVDAFCRNCGELYKAKYQRIIRGKGLFCSHKCAGTYNSKAMPSNGSLKVNSPFIMSGTKKKSPSSTRAQRIHARSVLQWLLEKGDLQRPSCCSFCHKSCKPDGHHDDYTKPKEVRWLCRSCHMKEHYRLGTLIGKEHKRPA